MPRATQIPEAQWNQHKEEILRLYPNMTDNYMLEYLYDKHGFRATSHQWERQRRLWGLEKYMSKERWQYVLSEYRKRKLEGKESDVIAHGRKLCSKKVKRAAAWVPVIDDSDHTKVAVPRGVVVSTPPASGDVITQPLSSSQVIAHMDHDPQMPFFQFSRMLDSLIEKLADNVFPSNERQSSLDVLAAAMTEETLGDLSYYPNSVYETEKLENIRREKLENIRREARKLVGECLGQDIDPDAPDYALKISSRLCEITIEERQGDFLRHAESFFTATRRQLPLYVLRYAVYVFSNGLLGSETLRSKTLDSEILDKLLRWILKNDDFWLIEHLIEWQIPSTESFANELIHSAVRLNDVTAVRALLGKGADPYRVVDGEFEEAARLLEIAMSNDNLELVGVLIDGFSQDKKFVCVQNALAFYLNRSKLSRADPSLVRLLLSHGACPNVPVGAGITDILEIKTTLLSIAIERSQIEVVSLLIEHGALVNDYISGESNTPLQAAAQYSTTKIAKLLLESGADVNAPLGETYRDTRHKVILSDFEKDFLETPLQLAAKEGNIEMALLLLEYGADVNGYTYAEFKADLDSMDCDDDKVLPYVSCWSPLQSAVRNSNVKLMRLLLTKHPDVNLMGHSWYMDGPGTALQYACAKPGNIEIVDMLLRHGADVNSPAHPRRGRTALQAAIFSQDTDIINRLLESNPDVNAAASPFRGMTALQYAVDTKNLDLVKRLLQLGADVNAEAAPRHGFTCLQLAAHNGNLEMLELLLRHRAEVRAPHAKVKGGGTALGAAVASSSLQAVQMLLDYGADPTQDSADPRKDSKQKGSYSPLILAVRGGNKDIVQLLLNHSADVNARRDDTTPLLEAIEKCNGAMVQLLIDAGADVNVSGRAIGAVARESERAIEVAARAADPIVLRMIIQANADFRGCAGVSVLYAAVESRRIDNIRFLLSLGINPIWPSDVVARKPGFLGNVGRLYEDFLGRVDESPEDEEILNLLLDHGADVNADYGLPLRRNISQLKIVQRMLSLGADVDLRKPNYASATALQEAVEFQKLDIIKALVEAGAHINALPKVPIGYTALQSAAFRYRPEIVEYLLSKGADADEPPPEEFGCTALQFAVWHGNLRMVSLLLSHGAHAAPANVHGLTALDKAAEFGRLDAMYLMLRHDTEPETLQLRIQKACKVANANGNQAIAKMLQGWKL